MKIVISILAIGFLAGIVYAYNAQHQSQLRQQQIEDYERQVNRLMSQVEDNSRLRLSFENRLGELESELTTLGSQLISTARELELAQKQVNPEYLQLEREIRQRITSELQTQSEGRNPASPLSLLTALSALEPTELAQLMSLQGQFGGFLQNLDVSEERKEIIMTALSNLIADQTQSRMDLMSEMRNQQLDRSEMRRKMQALSSPEAQREALSFDLTEDELAALAEFQDTRDSQRGASRAFNFQSGAGIGQGVSVFSGNLRDAQVAPRN